MSFHARRVAVAHFSVCCQICRAVFSCGTIVSAAALEPACSFSGGMRAAQFLVILFSIGRPFYCPLMCDPRCGRFFCGVRRPNYGVWTVRGDHPPPARKEPWFGWSPDLSSGEHEPLGSPTLFRLASVIFYMFACLSRAFCFLAATSFRFVLYPSLVVHFSISSSHRSSFLPSTLTLWVPT